MCEPSRFQRDLRLGYLFAPAAAKLPVGQPGADDVQRLRVEPVERAQERAGEVQVEF